MMSQRTPDQTGFDRRRQGRALVLAVLIAGSVLAVPGVVIGGDTVLILQPSVSPAQPTTAENFTVTTRVTNVDETDRAYYTVESVAVREGSGDDSTLYGQNDDHTLAVPGETHDIPVEVDVDQAGNRTLYVHTEITTPDDETITTVRPVSVVVRDQHPSISATAGELTASSGTPLTVTVANSLDNPIQGMTVKAATESGKIRDTRRVGATLEPGEATAFDYIISDAVAGSQDVTVTLLYTTPDGDQRSTTRNLEATVTEPQGVTPTMEAEAAPIAADGQTRLGVEVVNPRSDPIRGVALELRSDELDLTDRRAVQSVINAGEAATYSFKTEEVTPGQVNLTAALSYTTADGEDRRLARDIAVSLGPVDESRVDLTGLRLDRAQDTITLRGSASNVGSANVSGVVVSTANGEQVRPAQTESSFFVGNIPEGDFTSFEVTARVSEPNATEVTVPLEVSYVVDGVRVEQTVERTFVVEPTSSAEESTNGTGLPLGVVGGVAAVVVGAGLIIGWRLRG